MKRNARNCWWTLPPKLQPGVDVRAFTKWFALCLLAVGCASLPTTGSVATPTAIVGWTAPTTNTDTSPITVALTYNLYQGLQGAALAQVATGFTSLSATVTSGLTAGTTVCFAVTAVGAGQESAQSNPACKSFTASVPNAPTAISVK